MIDEDDLIVMGNLAKKMRGKTGAEKIRDRSRTNAPRSFQRAHQCRFSRYEWDDIIDKKEGSVQRSVSDDIQADVPKKRVITYDAPSDKCDREKRYELDWKFFSEEEKK